MKLYIRRNSRIFWYSTSEDHLKNCDLFVDSNPIRSMSIVEYSFESATRLSSFLFVHFDLLIQLVNSFRKLSIRR